MIDKSIILTKVLFMLYYTTYTLNNTFCWTNKLDKSNNNSTRYSNFKINVLIIIKGLLYFKGMSHSILLVNNDVSGQNSFWLVYNNFFIIKFTTGSYLAINAVVSIRWARQLLAVVLEMILSTRADVAEKHGSVAMCTFCVVMALWRPWDEVEAMTKSLEHYILSDKLNFQAITWYSTDTATHVGAKLLWQCNVAGQEVPW